MSLTWPRTRAPTHCNSVDPIVNVASFPSGVAGQLEVAQHGKHISCPARSDDVRSGCALGTLRFRLPGPARSWRSAADSTGALGAAGRFDRGRSRRLRWSQPPGVSDAVRLREALGT